MKGSKIAALLVGLTLAATLVLPMVNVIDRSTGVQTINNTSVEPVDPGNWSKDLPGYNANDGETVKWYNSTSGSNETLTEGTDYKIDQDQPRIKILKGGSVSQGDQVWATYDYQATDSTTSTIADLVPLFLVLLMLVSLGNKITG